MINLLIHFYFYFIFRKIIGDCIEINLNKCWVCGDRDKLINHIISESSKVGQQSTRLDWDGMGKVIHWEV